MKILLKIDSRKTALLSPAILFIQLIDYTKLIYSSE